MIPSVWMDLGRRSFSECNRLEEASGKTSGTGSRFDSGYGAISCPFSSPFLVLPCPPPPFFFRAYFPHFSSFQLPDGVCPLHLFWCFSSSHLPCEEFLVNFQLKLLVTLLVLDMGFFSCVLSVLGTIFLSSRFVRKDTTFSTGDLFSLGVTRIYTVPAGAGIKIR